MVARKRYKAEGWLNGQIKKRMKKRNAGHMVAKSCGGADVVSNKMWDDKRANHAHGARPVNDKAARRAGRR